MGSASMLGLDYGIIRFGSANIQTNPALFRSSVRQSLGLAVLSSGISTIILFAIIPHLAHWFQSESLVYVLRLAAVCLLLFVFYQMVIAAILISQKVIYSVGLTELVQPLSALVLILVFSKLDWGTSGALLALLISFIITFIGGVFFLHKLMPEVFECKVSDPWVIKPLLKFSLPVALTSVFSLNILWVDRLVIAIYGSNTDVGIYQAVSQSSLLFATILGSMNLIFIPMIANLFASGENKRLEALFRISTKWGLYLSVPFAVVLILKPEAFLLIAFGRDYSIAALPLQILTVAQLINVATGAVNLVLIMAGHQLYWMFSSALMLLVNIALGVVLVPCMGITGAAWGTAVSLVCLSIGGIIYTKVKLDILPYDRRYIKGILAASMALGGGWLMAYWHPAVLIIDLGLTFTVILIVFVGSLYFLGFDSEDKIFLNTLKNRVFFRDISDNVPLTGS